MGISARIYSAAACHISIIPLHVGKLFTDVPLLLCSMAWICIGKKKVMICYRWKRTGHVSGFLSDFSASGHNGLRERERSTLHIVFVISIAKLAFISLTITAKIEEQFWDWMLCNIQRCLCGCSVWQFGVWKCHVFPNSRLHSETWSVCPPVAVRTSDQSLICFLHF